MEELAVPKPVNSDYNEERITFRKKIRRISCNAASYIGKTNYGLCI
jgi:hypothetical protein